MRIRSYRIQITAELDSIRPKKHMKHIIVARKRMENSCLALRSMYVVNTHDQQKSGKVQILRLALELYHVITIMTIIVLVLEDLPIQRIGKPLDQNRPWHRSIDFVRCI